MKEKSYLEFLKYSIKDNPTDIPDTTSMDWQGLYDFCQQQAITGVVLDGIDRLSMTQKVNIPKKLLFEWIGQIKQIEVQNKLVNQRVKELTESLRKQGRKSCILKGQGNALMYPNPLHRLPGDIDVWLEGSKKEVAAFVHQRFSGMNVQYHHMSYPVFDDVEVEVHYYPSFCYNKWHNYKLLQFFQESSKTQFSNINSEGYAVPTVVFNLVFQLSHMMRHFFTQGIGLRHAIDYYYLLQQDISEKNKTEAIDVMKQSGMYKFFRAIMWIEKEVLELKKNTDIVSPNEKAGRIVLQEMLKGGNFGHYYKHNHNNLIVAYVSQMFYNMQHILEFPSEPLSRPFALTWDYINKHFRMLFRRL